ncbi:GntR family transcriptional regulator [uncultured Sphaerochaeta sp.]|uniref:GntR family transcriptional regulator n=1 Tax=uncultured Sphaerochaeta sp. TaxID=886478 RepID=UPI002A0A6C72|nr:GntR family transcriptional regulator [uncultured Sphaerochaeta sp.]
MDTKGSLKEMVYNNLVKDITSGVIQPNEIITEGSLIKRFQVSKAPVREALIELCKDNFLNSLPRLGYQVVVCSLKEIIDILDFRVDLEISNLRRAFPHITEDSLKVFDTYKLWELEEFSHKDIAENWFHNQKFHLLLCSISGNGYTYRSLEQLLKQNSRFFSQYYSYAWVHETESMGKFHESILRALRNGDLETSCNLLSADINAVKEQIQRVILNSTT